MKTNLKILLATAVLAFGTVGLECNGRVFAQENPDVTIVRTRQIGKKRTIDIQNNAFFVVLTTAETPNSTIGLGIKALEGYEDGVWIDLNNNKQKEAGEEITLLDGERATYVIQAPTVTLYGKITELDCSGNNLTALSTSNFSFLEKMNCSSNQITQLDVSRCNLLKDLICDNNNLALLKTGKMKALERLSCAGNLLTKLDVKKTNTLEWISCAGNSISGKQMAALLKSLPNRAGREQGAIIVGGWKDGEENNCTEEQKQIALAKNWEVKD